MFPITQPSDYKGSYLIPEKDKSLPPVIDEWETYYFELLLNAEIAKFIGETADASLPKKYQDLINGTIYTDTTKIKKIPVNTEGMKKALIRFVYFYFMRSNFSSTTGGTAKQIGANSQRLSNSENSRQVIIRYNEGVKIYNKLLEFVLFYGEVTGETTSTTDNLDDTYTIALTTQVYLESNDFIAIAGEQYEVVAVSENDITISATSGQTIEGNYSYNPFNLDELNLCPLDVGYF